jgi:hypothetical protein
MPPPEERDAPAKRALEQAEAVHGLSLPAREGMKGEGRRRDD